MDNNSYKGEIQMGRCTVLYNIRLYNTKILNCTLNFKKYLKKLPVDIIADVILSDYKESPDKHFIDFTVDQFKDILLSNKKLKYLIKLLFDKKYQNKGIEEKIILLLINSVLFDLYMDKKRITLKNRETKYSIINILTLSDSIFSDKSNTIDMFKEYKDSDIFTGSNLKAEYTDRTSMIKYAFIAYIANNCLNTTNSNDRKEYCFSVKLENIKKKHIINFISTTHRISEKEAHFILLKYTAKFVNALKLSHISKNKQMEYIYVMNEFTSLLCNITNAVTSIFIPETALKDHIKDHKKYLNPLSLSDALERVRRNISNRSKSYSDDFEQYYLKIIRKSINYKTVPELLEFRNASKNDAFMKKDALFLLTYLSQNDKEYLEIKNTPLLHIFSGDNDEDSNCIIDNKEFDGTPSKKDIKQHNISLNDSVNKYFDLLRYVSPQVLLMDVKILRNQVSKLSHLIHRYIEDKSSFRKIYMLCNKIYNDIIYLFNIYNIISAFDDKYNNQKKIIMDAALLMISPVSWKNKSMSLYDFIAENSRYAYTDINFNAISKFDTLHTVLFQQYLKTILYEFVLENSYETIDVIIELFNMIIDYIKNVIYSLYKSKSRNKNKLVLSSLIYNDINDYFDRIGWDKIHNDYYCCWDTRTSQGLIPIDEIEDLLETYKNEIIEML